MQVKKSIKKVGAVAGSALMVGMTFGAAAPLADFPQPFVDDDGQVQSQIVVGSQGKVADVVGAINIGASVGQAAVQTTEETASSDSADVDGKQFDDALRGTGVSSQWIDASDYSQLARKMVTDADGEDHRVLEQLGVQGTVNDDINGSDVMGNVADGAIQYKVSYTPGFNVDEEIEVMGDKYQVTGVTQDSDNNAQLKLGSKQDKDGLELGDSYEHGPYTVEVVDKDESNSAIYVEISKNGEVLKAQGLSTEAGEDDDMSVDNGAFELVADTVFFGSQRDYIDVRSTYTDTTLTAGAEESPFSDDWSVVSLAGAGYNDTEHAGTVTGFTLQNDVHTVSSPEDTDDEDDRGYLATGEAISGPNDYFSLTYQGLSDESTDSVKAADDNKVTFTDVEGFDHTLNLNDNAINDYFDASTQFYEANAGTSQNLGTHYVDIQGHPVTVQVDDGDTADDGVLDVTVSYKAFSASGTADNSGATGDVVIAEQSTGYGFTIEVNQVVGEIVDDSGTAGDEADLGLSINDGDTTNLAVNTAADGDHTDDEFHTDQGHEFGYDGTNDVLEVTEGGDGNGADTPEAHASGDATVTVNYGADSDTTTVDEVSYDTGSGMAVQHDGSDQEGRTTFGTVVETGSDNVAPVSLTVPENQLNAQFVLGSTETTSTDGETYRAIDDSAQGSLPSMAMLDSDVQESHKANNHLILVGGPAVNTLVADLVDEGDVDLSDLEGQSSGALIQGIDDAFADGQHALVVAGVNADDTRSAAQYISNYASHESALSDNGDRMVLAEADYPSEQ